MRLHVLLCTVLAVVVVSSSVVDARVCDGDVVIHSADELPLFADCTVIQGNLQLFNTSDVTSTEQFSRLRKISGDLYVWKNLALESLSFPELEEVGGQVDVLNCPLLFSLRGLERVARIGGHLKLWDNEVLSSLAGLDSLGWLGGLEVIANPALESLVGLPAAAVVTLHGDLVVSSNPSLRTLKGLEGMQRVTGSLRVDGNSELHSLAALNKLAAVQGNSFVLRDNHSLFDFSALASLKSVGGAAAADSSQGKMAVGPVDPVKSRCVPEVLLPYMFAPRETAGSVVAAARPVLSCERLASRLRLAGYPWSMREFLVELSLPVDTLLPRIEAQHGYLEQLLDLFPSPEAVARVTDQSPMEPSPSHTDAALSARLETLVDNDEHRRTVRAWVDTQNRWLRSLAGLQHGANAAAAAAAAAQRKPTYAAGSKDEL